MKKVFLFLVACLSSIMLFSQTTHWTPISSTTPGSMVLISKIQINGVDQESDQLELGVFCGDECRGATIAHHIAFPQLQIDYFLVDPMVYGDTGDSFTFKLYDHSIGQELELTPPASIVFTDDGYGTIPNPYVLNFTGAVVETYTISATANPEEGGTVTGGGSYEAGDTCTLVASANAGYSFVNWTKEGDVVSSNATYEFTVTESASYVANFNFGGTHWTPISSTTPGSMVLIGKIQINGVDQESDQLELGVFCGDECRGATIAHHIAFPQLQIDYFLVDPMVYGDTGDSFTFKLYDHSIGQELELTPPASIVFTDDGYGTIPNPYVLNFTGAAVETYTISVTANPEEGGTVTGGGSYEAGDTCTLVASANAGYTFVNWTVADGLVVSTDASYTFIVTEDAAYVAHFSLNSYEITATANPADGGNVGGGGTFNHGQSCTLTATANTGYHFVNWTKGGEVVSTDATYSFTVTEDATYVANFSVDTYEITVTVNPTEAGTITGAGTYNYGEEVTLSVTPNAGYTFINWTKDGEEVSTSLSFTITVTEDAAYVANFSVNTYSITASTNLEGAGNITISGDGVYTYGEEVTLSVTPNPGYTFINWTKDGVEVSTDLSFNITVVEDAVYVANFSVNTYSITATTNPEGAGNITISGDDVYTYGEEVTLTVTPNAGYTFVNWTKDGVEVSTDLSFNITVVEDAVYVANFSVNTYSITATTNPEGAGNITISGDDVYTYGEEVTLTVTPNAGYTFVNWTKDGVEVSTDLSFNITVVEDAVYVANFTVDGYLITASTNPEGAGTITMTGNGVYTYGEEVTLTVIPNAGYTFVNWTKEGVEVSTDLSFVVTVIEDAVYVANFTVDGYLITASTNPEGAGTITMTGNGVYTYGEEVTLTVIPNAGYTFVNWTKEGEEVSTDLSFVVTVVGDATYVANFSVNTYSITATTNPEGAGNITISGDGVYTYGEEVTLSVTPNAGYTFVNWTKEGVEVSTDLSFVVTVIEDAVYVANFTVDGYLITASTNPEGAGTITMTGNGVYTYGEEVTLSVEPNPGYTFINWTSEGEEVSTDLSFVVTVVGDATYVANFSVNTYSITASTNPEGAGNITISGDGVYTYGEEVTLSVTPNAGYTFINWTKDGVEVSTDLSFAVTVVEDAIYVANFSVNTYSITATTNPEGAGNITISGDGVYTYGEEVTLSVTPNAGYTFVNWTKDGVEVSTDLSFVVTVIEDAAYVANFSVDGYLITATTNPVGAGTITMTGNGVYSYGEEVTLTVTPNAGYTFINWTKDGVEVSTDLSFNIVVIESATYVANFQINSYTITAMASPTDAGTVTGAGTYDYGTSITLTATAEEGYTFINWTKDGSVVSTSPNYTIIVTEDATYVANFELNSYTITATANPSIGGTVSGGGTFNHFETCTLIATPADDYIFINWTKNGVVVSTDATYSFTVVGSGNYVANFSTNEFQINVSANPSNGGIVTGTGVYLYGATATLTATANTDFDFVNWTKNGVVVSTSANYSFTVTEAGNYVANFSRNNYQITVMANPTEGGTISGGGTYNYGQICTLTATAATGYSFVNWTKNGTVVSNNPSYSFTVTEDATYIANFSLNMYTITVSADPAAGGMVSGGSTYLYGENCTVSAVSNAGYTFTNWTKNGTVVSTEAAYSFTVTESANLVAHFSLDHYNITVSVDPDAGGNATGGGSYTYGETCNLTATAATGYAFVNWTKNGTVVSSNANYSFTVTDSGDYVAHFAVARYTITVIAEPAEGGTVYGGGTYDFGHVVTLRAIANEGYVFVNWTRDGAVISSNANHPIIVREDAEYVAHFRINAFQILAKTDPEYTGDIEGAGLYNYGETCTLSVTPHDEYEFINWTLDGQVVSEEESFTFVVTEAREYVAHLNHVDGIGEHGGITITLFPNPAKNNLTIEASEPINVLEIYNINGALVYRQNDCSDKVEINVETYAIGTYMVRLTTDSTVEIRRFVKE